MSRYAILYAT